MLNPEARWPKFGSKPIRRRSIISLTPLIDVVFILLIFFMLASSFMQWKAIDLVVESRSVGSTSTNETPLLLTVREQTVQLDDEEMQLMRAIGAINTSLRQNPNRPVLIRPIQDTSLQATVKVLDALRSNGISRFSLSRDLAWKQSSHLQASESRETAP